jgi:hypothetical protein
MSILARGRTYNGVRRVIIYVGMLPVMYAVNFYVDNIMGSYKYPRCCETFQALVSSWTSQAWWVTRVASQLQIRFPAARV